MKIFALNPSKISLSKEFIEKLGKFGEVTAYNEKKPVLEITGITDKDTEKVLLISPLYVENWKLETEVIDAIPNLKAICLTSTSYSWLDVEYLAKKNIPVFNGGNYSTNAVAEGALMMALVTARKIPLIVQNNWSVSYDNHLGFELAGKTAGIIGLGNIGTRIAELCQAIGMNVIYWSKNSKDERFKYSELASLMKESDIIFPTLAQNSETENLITDDMLKGMKQNAIFVSVVHKIYNHELLNELVREGKVFGYANEESEAKIPDLDGNIWTGFPVIWYTKESIARNHEIILSNIENAVNGNFKSSVNL